MSKLGDMKKKAEELKEKMKEKITKTVEDIKDSTILAANDIGAEVKDTAYKTISKIEKKVEPHQDKIDAAKDALKKGIETVKGVASDVQDTYQGVKKNIEEQGGIENAINNTAEKVTRKISDHAERFGNNAEAYINKKLEETLFTDGAYDPVKAKKFGKNTVEMTTMYGSKAVTAINEVIVKGIKGYAAWKEVMIPNQDELDGKYLGIGRKYNGRLYRPNYEDCLAFHALAEEHLPQNLDLTKVILTDIKESASASLVELVSYYNTDDSVDKFAKQVVAKKYLAEFDSRHPAESHS